MPEAILACWRTAGIGGDHSCPELAVHVHCRNCPSFVGEGRRLLDRPAPDADYLAGWQRELDAARREAPAAAGACIVFRLGEEWFALPAAVVERAASARRPLPIPHRSVPALPGLVNVEGELLLCVALAAFLGIPKAPAASAGRERLLVVGRERERWALLVDEVEGLAAPPSDGDEPPASVARAAGALTRRLVAIGSRRVAELDDEALLARLRSLVPGAL